MRNKSFVVILLGIAAFVVLLCLFSNYWLEDTKGKMYIHRGGYGSSRTGIHLPVVSPTPATKPVSNVSYTGGEVNVGSVSSSGLAVPMVRTSAVTTRSYSGGMSMRMVGASYTSGNTVSSKSKGYAVASSIVTPTSYFTPVTSSFIASTQSMMTSSTNIDAAPSGDLSRRSASSIDDWFQELLDEYISTHGNGFVYSDSDGDYYNEDWLRGLYELWCRYYGSGATPDIFKQLLKDRGWHSTSTQLPIGDGLIPLLLLALVYSLISIKKSLRTKLN